MESRQMCVWMLGTGRGLTLLVSPQTLPCPPSVSQLAGGRSPSLCSTHPTPYSRPCCPTGTVGQRARLRGEAPCLQLDHSGTVTAGRMA